MKSPLNIDDMIMVRKKLKPGELPCRCAGKYGQVISVKDRPIIAVCLNNGEEGTWLERCLIRKKKRIIISTEKPKEKVCPAPKLKKVVKHTAVKRSAKKFNASARSCPGSDHQSVVEHIESLGYDRFRFRKKVLAALTANGEETELGEPGKYLSSIVPDVFKIDPDKKIIYVVEVENSKGVFSKLRNYEVLWFYLDCEEWDLVLSTISKTDIEIFRAIRSLPTTIVPFGYPGNVVEDDERKLTLIGHPIDLCTFYCQGLYEDRGKLKDQGSASLVPSDRRVPSPTLERITE